MNRRERTLANVLLAGIVLAGLGFLGKLFWWDPLVERDQRIATLQKEIGDRRERVRRIEDLQVMLEEWRQMSLPHVTRDDKLAQREYEKHLSELMRQSGFAAGSFSVSPKPPDSRTSPTLGVKKEPIYTRLTFTVHAQADLASLVKLFERFYRTPLLHQIKTFSIQRPVTTTGQQQANSLDLNMIVEALIVTGAENRPHLLPAVDRRLLLLDALATLRRAPAGLGLVVSAAGPAGPLGPRKLAEPPRQYAAIADKNIFFGIATEPERPKDEVDVSQFVFLTDITHSEKRVEAFLYDRFNNKRTRLRASAGFDSFRVTDSQGETLVRGKVLKIDQRDIIFQVNDKLYSIHVGESLQEALKKPLKPEEAKPPEPAPMPEEKE